MAFDEGRFGLKMWLRRRWCPKGFRPPWIVEDHYEWLWVYAAVEPQTGRALFLFLPSMQAGCLQIFLDQLRESWPHQRIGVVLDNAPSHRCGQIHWPDGLVPLSLPPYSPELNPAEPIFRLLHQRLANRIFETLDELREALTSCLEEFWELPQILVQLTSYPWWIDGLQAL